MLSLPDGYLSFVTKSASQLGKAQADFLLDLWTRVEQQAPKSILLFRMAGQPTSNVPLLTYLPGK